MVDADKRAQYITDELVSRSVRPVVNPGKVHESIEQSLVRGTPLRMRMVLCPNWQVGEKGRSVGEIAVSTEGNHLVIHDESMKIVPFLTEEVPGMLGFLVANGLTTQLLVVFADILSNGWVHDPKTTKVNLAQNQKAIKLLLMSSEKGKEVANNPSRVDIRVQSQLQLATNTPEYADRMSQFQQEALTFGTPMFNWYLEVIRRLQEIGEYGDQRMDVAGMRKIWDRALFLAAIYALDGKVIRGDFDRSGFAQVAEPSHIALGTVGTAHGDIIAAGWNLEQDPIGVVTPFNNVLEHSWSEPRVKVTNYPQY